MPPFIPHSTKITWTCHACGQERPDEKISTATAASRSGSIRVNRRYCNDSPDCRETAYKQANQELATFLKEP